jgi:GT2 family glycosyltransferase
MIVSILIVSYNTRDLTLACLRSLFEQTTQIQFEVIVVDNASADGSADAIAAEFPAVRLIRLTENAGFAAGNNIAAREASGRYLLLLNPDTLVLDRAIERLVEFAGREPDARIWGGRTLFADHSLNPASCWRAPTLWSVACIATGLTSLFRGSPLFAPESYGAWPRDTVRAVDIVSGCFLLIERATWKRLGGFDPAFFMYGEEADLCLRAREIGARPMITPDAAIVHYGGASERIREDKMVRLLQAKARLLRRHWSPARARLGVAVLTLWPLSRSLACSVMAWSKRLGRGRAPDRPAAAPTNPAAASTTWRAIWRRRHEWLKDSPPPPPPPPRTPSPEPLPLPQGSP